MSVGHQSLGEGIKPCVLLAFVPQTPSIALGAYQVNWLICERDSKRGRCIEKGSFSIGRVDKKVIAVGYNPLGSQVSGDLKNCSTESPERWSCDDGTVRVEGDSENVRVVYTGRPLSVNGKRFEFSSMQRKRWLDEFVSETGINRSFDFRHPPYLVIFKLFDLQNYLRK